MLLRFVIGEQAGEYGAVFPQKFEGAEQTIGTEMKSVGEVMAIGRSFAEALQKALRMLEIGVDGLDPQAFDFPELQSALRSPTPRRIFAIAQALDAGMHPDQVAELTRIDGFFIKAMARIVSHARDLKANRVLLAEHPTSDAVTAVVRQAKCDGFSDRYLATQWGMTEDEVRTLRGRLGIHPGLSHIDTLAAEYPAETGFLYLSYRATASEVQPPARKKVLILGSGCYRIGSSVEFDWCAVTCARKLRDMGKRTVMINYNPETVSTDFDEADRLYFEELGYERVMDIYELEQAHGVVVSVGGRWLKVHLTTVNNEMKFRSIAAEYRSAVEERRCQCARH